MNPISAGRCAAAPRIPRLIAFLLAAMLSPACLWARQASNDTGRQSARVSLDLSTAYEHLGAGYQPWRDVSAAVASTFAPRTSAFVGATFVNRFDKTDAQLGIGGSLPASSRWTVGAELRGSSSHRLLARTEAQLWVHRRLQHGWGAQLRVEQRNFTPERVATAAALLERYVGLHRVWYEAAVTSLGRGVISPNQRLGLTVGSRRGDALTLSATHGNEAAIDGAGRVLLVPVLALDTWGVRPINTQWMVTYSVGSTLR